MKIKCSLFCLLGGFELHVLVGPLQLLHAELHYQCAMLKIHVNKNGCIELKYLISN
jgi:hypothetical protein